jgi:outer membrane protein TolC
MGRIARIRIALCAAFVSHAAAGRAQPSSGYAMGTNTAPPMTVAQAVAVALEHNPDALTRDSQVREAESSRAQAGGAFGPRLQVDANAQRWTSPYTIGFGGAGTFTVRDASTWTAAVEIIQPITTLLGIYDQYKVRDLGVDVAAIQREMGRRDVALAVVEGYYRLLEAQRLAEVADASVSQLEAQEKQALSLFTNGVIGKNDLLRAGLALASARQRAIQARGQVELAAGRLATSMGVSDSEPLQPIPYSGEPPASSEATLAGAEAHAVARRPELRELDRRIDQADRDVSFARTGLIPQVSAVGNYTHTEGSPFQPVDAAYAGLVASWNVWDWGATLSAVKVTESKLRQARLARKKAEDEVRLEVRQAFVNAATAREALAVARTAVSQAEENYRIVTRKFESAAATSFDVVDAEGLLTQTRGQVESALYDLLIAQAALDKATGAGLPGYSPP